MIRRIAYANDDWTRTADVVPGHETGQWKVHLGNRADAEAETRFARTMTQCQAWARQWVSGEVPR